MTLASERAYFDGDHCQHVAAFHEAARLARIERRFRNGPIFARGRRG